MLDLEVLKPEKVRPLTRDDFEKLISLEAFEDEHLELLRGVLVTMSTQKEPHARITAWFHDRLSVSLDLYEVRSHTSYAATRDSVPEPDVQVLERTLRRRLPRRALLLVEVSESSYNKDRTIKAPIYGENRAPEYWIVDLRDEVVWVHTRPTRTGYAQVERHASGDTLRPIRLPGLEIAVADIPWAPRDQPRREPRRRSRRVTK